ncbi:unnamed protein product [Auanema sp. JU1783]|nr:unnamed protein product [Auanema sp. JU1783]
MIPYFRIFCFFCIWTYVDAQEKRKAFAEKLINETLTKQFKPPEITPITDAVLDEIIKKTPYKDVDFKTIVLEKGPPGKALLIANIKNDVDKCLKDKGLSIKAEDVIKIATPPIEKTAKPLYVKYVDLAAKNKKNSAVRSVLYEQGLKDLTQDLVKTIISNVAKEKDMKCPILQCVVEYVSVAIKFGKNVQKANCKLPKT